MTEDIDLKKAAEATLKYIDMLEDNGTSLVEAVHLPHELSTEHQKHLLEQIIKGRMWGAKAHRCLGWAQCALMINGIGDLVVYRMINYCCKV